jgi:hypothetical protein
MWKWSYMYACGSEVAMHVEVVLHVGSYHVCGSHHSVTNSHDQYTFFALPSNALFFRIRITLNAGGSHHYDAGIHHRKLNLLFY